MGLASVQGDLCDRYPAAWASCLGSIDPEGHIWLTRSRHSTSDGVVSYQRCRCGLWRVVRGASQVLAETRSTATSAGELH